MPLKINILSRQTIDDNPNLKFVLQTSFNIYKFTYESPATLFTPETRLPDANVPPNVVAYLFNKYGDIRLVRDALNQIFTSVNEWVNKDSEVELFSYFISPDFGVDATVFFLEVWGRLFSHNRNLLGKDAENHYLFLRERALSHETCRKLSQLVFSKEQLQKLRDGFWKIPSNRQNRKVSSLIYFRLALSEFFTITHSKLPEPSLPSVPIVQKSVEPSSKHNSDNESNELENAFIELGEILEREDSKGVVEMFHQPRQPSPLGQQVEIAPSSPSDQNVDVNSTSNLNLNSSNSNSNSNLVFELQRKLDGLEKDLNTFIDHFEPQLELIAKFDTSAIVNECANVSTIAVGKAKEQIDVDIKSILTEQESIKHKQSELSSEIALIKEIKENQDKTNLQISLFMEENVKNQESFSERIKKLEADNKDGVKKDVDLDSIIELVKNEVETQMKDFIKDELETKLNIEKNESFISFKEALINDIQGLVDEQNHLQTTTRTHTKLFEHYDEKIVEVTTESRELQDIVGTVLDKVNEINEKQSEDANEDESESNLESKTESKTESDSLNQQNNELLLTFTEDLKDITDRIDSIEAKMNVHDNEIDEKIMNSVDECNNDLIKIIEENNQTFNTLINQVEKNTNDIISVFEQSEIITEALNEIVQTNEGTREQFVKLNEKIESIDLKVNESFESFESFGANFENNEKVLNEKYQKLMIEVQELKANNSFLTNEIDEIKNNTKEMNKEFKNFQENFDQVTNDLELISDDLNNNYSTNMNVVRLDDEIKEIKEQMKELSNIQISADIPRIEDLNSLKVEMNNIFNGFKEMNANQKNEIEKILNMNVIKQLSAILNDLNKEIDLITEQKIIQFSKATEKFAEKYVSVADAKINNLTINRFSKLEKDVFESKSFLTNVEKRLKNMFDSLSNIPLENLNKIVNEVEMLKIEIEPILQENEENHQLHKKAFELTEKTKMIVEDQLNELTNQINSIQKEVKSSSRLAEIASNDVVDFSQKNEDQQIILETQFASLSERLDILESDLAKTMLDLESTQIHAQMHSQPQSFSSTPLQFRSKQALNINSLSNEDLDFYDLNQTTDDQLLNDVIRKTLKQGKKLDETSRQITSEEINSTKQELMANLREMEFTIGGFESSTKKPRTPFI
eukprot:TRINITY_DN3276_c2_g5_i1.p1 TRINITY_DN3276_c2_g5~~TRINITY_DN3276_c2_g5_i1.p1  ORF type:complete len:1157 (-),score=449.04 TRINITY_DN3276_c2_g5_i1:56-3499(-)